MLDKKNIRVLDDMITKEEGLLMRFAGMMDCDGSIGIYIDNNGFMQKIQFTNTDYRLIQWILDNFGGGVAEYNYSNPKWKDKFNWQLYGYKSYKLINRIRPFLMAKQEQADLAIELYKKVSK